MVFGPRTPDGVLAPTSGLHLFFTSRTVAGMRVVITGCAGFVGSHLTERLLAEGCRVTGIDALTAYYDPAEKRANLTGLLAHRRFDFVRADLVTAPLAELFAGRPHVVHLAAQPGVRRSFGDGFDQYVHDNVLATQRVFEAAAEANCPRLVYASSSSAYGDAARYPCTETTPTRPRSPYGVTKRTGEKLADIYRGLGLDAVGLRYFTVYGPRQRPDMAIRRLCEAAAGGPEFRLHGDGTQIRDFTYVEDAVEATVLALTADRTSPLLNVGGGQEASMSEVIELLSDLAGEPIPVRCRVGQLGDVHRTGADTSLARSELCWVPTVTLAEGLEASLDWVRRRRGAGVPIAVGAS